MDELLGTGFEVAEKDRLYRCLDRVLEHKQELFAYLKQKWADLFGADSEVLLYDLISTYFEGELARLSHLEGIFDFRARKFLLLSTPALRKSA